MKIIISGPSGSGKTTLAEYISKRYMIPFVTTSAKTLWKKYDIKSHKGLITKCTHDLDFGIKFQEELLNMRAEIDAKSMTYVSDRGPIDNMVYFLMQLSPYLDDETIENYMWRCRDLVHAMGFYKQIVIDIGSPEGLPEVIPHDGFRISSKYYQCMSNRIFRYIVEEDWLSVPSIVTISKWDWDTRVNIVDNLFKEENKTKKIWQNLKNTITLNK